MSSLIERVKQFGWYLPDTAWHMDRQTDQQGDCNLRPFPQFCLWGYNSAWRWLYTQLSPSPYPPYHMPTRRASTGYKFGWRVEGVSWPLLLLKRRNGDGLCWVIALWNTPTSIISWFIITLLDISYSHLFTTPWHQLQSLIYHSLTSAMQWLVYHSVTSSTQLLVYHSLISLTQPLCTNKSSRKRPPPSTIFLDLTTVWATNFLIGWSPPK